MRQRRRSARYHDFDVVLAGDFRSAGEVGETMASHLEILATTALDVGLLWLRDPTLPASTPPHDRLAGLVRRRLASPIEPDTETVSTAVLLLYEPRLLVSALPGLPRMRAERTLVVLAQPLMRRDGPSFDVGAAAAAIAEQLSRRQLWCPATPTIRAQYLEHARGLALDPEDLAPCEPVSTWRTSRLTSDRRRPVLGRILRYDDDRLPAKRERLLEAHPAEPDVEMRFLGGEVLLRELVQPLPPHWQLLAPGKVGPKRFLSRLDAYVQFHDEPTPLFPRAVLQAMASGRLAILAPCLRPVFGDGPAYRDPDQVAETIRYLHAEPRFYARYLAEQDTALATRFSPRQLLGRLGDVVEPRRARPPAPAARPRTVALYPTNGVGLGHVTRLLAVARRLTPRYEPVFFTPCHALAVIEHAGFRAEYVPEPLYDETDPADHARAMAPRLAAALGYYDPAAIVFDGNVPRDALLDAAAETDIPLVWVRRGMWRADPALDRHVAQGRRFDAVIEPAEAAASVDQGATSRATDDPVAVPPIMLLDRGELLDGDAARRELGLAPRTPAALVQLGSGNNNDIERHLDHLVDAAGRLGIQLMIAEWLIQYHPVRRRGLRYLSGFPNARHFRAFDFAVSAAGYNSFHELLHHGVPCIFVPNDNQQVDDQRARATWAESRGAGICVPRGAESALPAYMAAMLDPVLRRQLARRGKALCPVNGAAAAAEAITAIAVRG